MCVQSSLLERTIIFSTYLGVCMCLLYASALCTRCVQEYMEQFTTKCRDPNIIKCCKHLLCLN